MFDFYKNLARISNSGQSRSIVISGNIYDLFYVENDFFPIIPFLCNKTTKSDTIQIVYELNGPIRIVNEKDKPILHDAWCKWKCGFGQAEQFVFDAKANTPDGKLEIESHKKGFYENCLNSIVNPTLALEFLRQLTICSRTCLDKNLFIIIEAADLIVPAGNDNLTDSQFRRIGILQDWFSEISFMNGNDIVCLLAESKYAIHSRISRMPQLLSVDVPAPNFDERVHFILQSNKNTYSPKIQNLARSTAGLSLMALRQLLKSDELDNLKPQNVISKVEEFIQSQLGEDIVEFKKPSHTLNDVIGFRIIKKFIQEEMIPRIKAPADMALSGAAVAGPIGAGKTFIFEAMASELDMPVIVIKNIRSQWFGQTDVIFERLKRVLESLEKVVVFVDEADTQFGDLGSESHSTEKRLTGKIQAMMSDPKLKGKVVWLLMTARIEKLSPDIRRPGRAGDLIIPILDPCDGVDVDDFIRWMISPILDFDELTSEQKIKLRKNKTSPASYSMIKSYLKFYAGKIKQGEEFEFVENSINDHCSGSIELTRRYQTIQAILNCTRPKLIGNAYPNQKCLYQELDELSVKLGQKNF